MNFASRGVRDAFRNTTRSISIIVILGLAIGLALSMLLAHQAVGQKINLVKSSVDNTISIVPAGFIPGSQANNALSTSQLDKVRSLAHITSLDESLTDRLTTIGTDSSPRFDNSPNDNNQTSLKSPVTLNTGGNGAYSGNGFHISILGGGNLPANFSPPIQIIGTNNPSRLANGTNTTIKSGQMIDGNKDSNDAMVSTGMASKNNLSVGSTFTAYGTTLSVKGIFDSGTHAGNNAIIVSLPAEQRLSGQSGDVTDAEATIDSIDNLTSTTQAVKNVLGSSADVTNGQTETQDTIDSLQSIDNVSLYSLIGAVAAGAVIIFLTMLMVVRERRREIGVFKAIGASNLKIMMQFVSEAVTLTILAAVVGILIGLVAADPITKTLVNNSNGSSSVSSQAFGGPIRGQFARNFSGGAVTLTPRGKGLGGALRSDVGNIHAVVGWSILGYGLGAALVIAVVGSGVASFSISKVRPAEVLRTE